MSSLEKYLFRSFSHFSSVCLFFFFYWYWVISAACIFWKLILCHHYLLPLWGLSFHLVCSFLCSAKSLSLIRSHLFIFISITLGGGSWKILLWFMSLSVLLMFSFESFITSCLTFRSLIHFEFIFVYGFRKYSNFILFHVAFVFPAPLI